MKTRSFDPLELATESFRRSSSGTFGPAWTGSNSASPEPSVRTLPEDGSPVTVVPNRPVPPFCRTTMSSGAPRWSTNPSGMGGTFWISSFEVSL